MRLYVGASKLASFSSQPECMIVRNEHLRSLFGWIGQRRRGWPLTCLRHPLSCFPTPLAPAHTDTLSISEDFSLFSPYCEASDWPGLVPPHIPWELHTDEAQICWWSRSFFPSHPGTLLCNWHMCRLPCAIRSLTVSMLWKEKKIKQHITTSQLIMFLWHFIPGR